jgi:hypothetical protein
VSNSVSDQYPGGLFRIIPSKKFRIWIDNTIQGIPNAYPGGLGRLLSLFIVVCGIVIVGTVVEKTKKIYGCIR